MSTAGGSLPQPGSPRRYGIPVALAVVAIVGSALLAEPPAEDPRGQPRRW